MIRTKFISTILGKTRDQRCQFSRFWCWRAKKWKEKMDSLFWRKIGI